MFGGQITARHDHDQLSENSYGFSPGRNQVQAVESAQKIVQSGKGYVVDIDLSKFFDKLVVNREKSQVVESSLVKFLGMTKVNGTRAIARKSIRRAMDKVKELTPRETHETLEDTIKGINRSNEKRSHWFDVNKWIRLA